MDARAKLRKMLNKADITGVCFRPTPLQVSRTYNILNNCLFGGVLQKPTIIIRRMPDAWGLCEGDVFTGKDRWTNDPICHRIVVNDEFPSFKFFIEVLAHEMVHQYQCDYLNRMDHGQTFWHWESKFNRCKLRLFTARSS